MNLTREENVYCTEEGEFFGTLAGSVGPWGESTGAFTRCETTSPLSELGVAAVNGLPIQPWE